MKPGANTHRLGRGFRLQGAICVPACARRPSSSQEGVRDLRVECSG